MLVSKSIIIRSEKNEISIAPVAVKNVDEAGMSWVEVAISAEYRGLKLELRDELMTVEEYNFTISFFENIINTYESKIVTYIEPYLSIFFILPLNRLIFYISECHLFKESQLLEFDIIKSTVQIVNRDN